MDQAILEELQQFYLDNPLKIWIPTLQESHDFRPISVAQQKYLLDLEGTDEEQGIAYYVNAPRALNSLIKASCVDEEVYNKITVLDRPAILLQLKYDVKNVIALAIDEELVEVDLSPFVDGLTKKKKPRKLKYKDMFTVGNIVVYMKMPTLAIDEAYNQYFLDQSQRKQNVNLNEITGDAYFAEVAKYIDRIVFETGKEKKVANFSDFDPETFANNIVLLEELPSSVTTKISDYIAFSKKYQISLVTENIDVNGNDKKVFLDIDVPFFTTL